MEGFKKELGPREDYCEEHAPEAFWVPSTANNSNNIGTVQNIWGWTVQDDDDDDCSFLTDTFESNLLLFFSLQLFALFFVKELNSNSSL